MRPALGDHLGSTRAVLDGGGNVIGSYDSEPFGAALAVAGVDSCKGFIDKETDTETSTANHGVRQYDAETGRFTSVDPLWESFPGRSPYHYCYNSPLILVDGNGKNPVLAPIVGGIVEALGIGIGAGITAYIAISLIEEEMNFSEWMRAPAASTSVDPMSGFVDLPPDNGTVLSAPQAYLETSEGQWGLFLALIDAVGGDDETPSTEPKSGAESLPDLTGKSREEAAEALKGAGLKTEN